jgi:hypothetical protein
MAAAGSVGRHGDVKGLATSSAVAHEGEVQKAQHASPAASGDTIFAKIISGKIPATFVHQVLRATTI